VVNNIFFQYYSLLITLVCIGIMFAVSYLTEAPAYEKISGLTYATMTEEDQRQSRASWGSREVWASVLVLAFILSAYLYFTG
jgi:SSS family solute:Na+ symporter